MQNGEHKHKNTVLEISSWSPLWSAFEQDFRIFRLKQKKHSSTVMNGHLFQALYYNYIYLIKNIFLFITLYFPTGQLCSMFGTLLQHFSAEVFGTLNIISLSGNKGLKQKCVLDKYIIHTFWCWLITKNIYIF